VFSLALVAAVQPTAAAQPRQAALDHPPVLAEPAGGFLPATGDARHDLTAAEPVSQVVVVITLVRVEALRAAAPGAVAGADRRDATHQYLVAQLECPLDMIHVDPAVMHGVHVVVL